MSLTSLPAELVVQVLMRLEPEQLSRCDRLSRLFHGPSSLVEQALRALAAERAEAVPSTLPPCHANWTQKLLWDEVLRRSARSSRPVLAAAKSHSAFVTADGEFLICGTDDIEVQPPLLGRGSGGGLVALPTPAPITALAGVRVHSVAAAESYILALSTDGVPDSVAFLVILLFSAHVQLS